MRLAPVPVFYHQSPKKALQYTSLQSRITHASPVAVQSCLLASLQIVGFVNSEKDTAKARKEEVLASRFVPKGLEGVDIEISEREIVNLWEGEWKSNTVDEISTSGFVVHSHEAALWALWNTETFEEGMLLLLPLGSDVDTVCAIYGQLAGACYGYESIPKRWLDGLQKREILDQVFGTLVELSSQVSDAETTAA
ncbi:ADP-ribosylglycohydrolase [Sistotremastrum suecicum HHB10207 ss-3]|nr:ADP-ribosylglycohydrolase [Sistotremastrum suecicum HHB10207 ss-3]